MMVPSLGPAAMPQARSRQPTQQTATSPPSLTSLRKRLSGAQASHNPILDVRRAPRHAMRTGVQASPILATEDIQALLMGVAGPLG